VHWSGDARARSTTVRSVKNVPIEGAWLSLHGDDIQAQAPHGPVRQPPVIHQILEGRQVDLFLPYSFNLSPLRIDVIPFDPVRTTTDPRKCRSTK
jgi:hypothetical protein